MRTLAAPVFFLCVVVAAIAGCADPDDDPGPELPIPCPADEDLLVQGEACTTDSALSCRHVGTSYCGSGFGGLYRCSCVDGTWACEDTYPSDGDVCDWPEGTICYREGNPDCVTMPTGGSCGCADGIWTCDSACWHSCPAHWDPNWIQSPPACSSSGQHCALPGGHTCDCTGGRYVCQ